MKHSVCISFGIEVSDLMTAYPACVKPELSNEVFENQLEKVVKISFLRLKNQRFTAIRVLFVCFLFCFYYVMLSIHLVNSCEVSVPDAVICLIGMFSLSFRRHADP